MALAARLLSPIAGTRWWARPGSVAPRSLLALGAVEALGQVADRGLKRFHLRLQGRFALQEPRVLCTPVVRLPLELDIGLLRQHHCLLREGGGARRTVRRHGGGRGQLWLSLFHEGCYTRLLRKIPWCSERRDGLT